MQSNQISPRVALCLLLYVFTYDTHLQEKHVLNIRGACDINKMSSWIRHFSCEHLPFSFLLLPRKKKRKKSGGETSSSPAGESWGGNQIAAATVWHSSVITVKSVFFLWKASFHSQIFPMFESWVPVPTKWLLAWKWKPPWRGPLKWFAKWGRFSHKVVTFSKIRSSAVPNYGVCVNWSAPLGDETLHLFVAVVICVAAVIIFYRKPAFWCGRKKQAVCATALEFFHRRNVQ